MVVVPLGAGDFIAISKLVYRIGVEIKQNAKSAPEYRLLLIELESLDRALKWLQSIQPAHHELRKLDAIRAVASTCQQPLEDFLAKIEKFEHRLGSFAPCRRSIARVTRGLQWSLKYNEEVKTLRAKLAPNVATITILLLTQTTDTLAIAEIDRATMLHEIDTRLESQQRSLQQVQQTSFAVAEAQGEVKSKQVSLHLAISDQSQALSDLQSRAEELLAGQAVHEEHLRGQNDKLKTIAENELSTQSQLQDCKDLVGSIDRTTRDIKGLVPSILERVLDLMEVITSGVRHMQNIAALLSQILNVTIQFSKDMMHTMENLLQAFCDLQRQVASLERWLPKHIDLPIIRFRDAFNDVRIFPFDLSREWVTFQRLVHVTLTNKQGLHRVNMGQYFVTNARNSQRLWPRFWRHAIQPGDELAMTMILDDHEAEDGYCPFKSCGASTVNIPLIGCGKICNQCNRFATIAPKGASFQHLSPHNTTEEPLSAPRVLTAPAASANELGKEDCCPLPAYGPLLWERVDEDIELYHSVQVAEMLFAREMSDAQGGEMEFAVPQPSTNVRPASPEHDNLSPWQMQVFVRIMQGETKIIRADPSDTVLSVKEQLHKTEKIPPCKQRLLFEGKCLRDGLRLADYNIHKNNTIDLMPELATPFPWKNEDPGKFWARPLPSKGERILVHVKTLTGKTINLNIENDKTVGAIKQELFKLEGIAPELQRLIYAGKQLKDGTKLFQHDLRQGSNLYLVIRLLPTEERVKKRLAGYYYRASQSSQSPYPAPHPVNFLLPFGRRPTSSNIPTYHTQPT